MESVSTNHVNPTETSQNTSKQAHIDSSIISYMNEALPKSITNVDTEAFNLFESLNKAKGAIMKWAAFNEKTRRGSLAGKVFTGGYALIFGWVRMG